MMRSIPQHSNNGGQETEREFRGVEEVADLLGVSARALRFYEEKGLVRPGRIGRIRIYTASHVRSLRIVMRAKLLGLRLSDIGRFLRAHEADDMQHEQHSVHQAQRIAYIEMLERQQQAISLSLQVLRRLHDDAARNRRA